MSDPLSPSLSSQQGQPVKGTLDTMAPCYPDPLWAEYFGYPVCPK